MNSRGRRVKRRTSKDVEDAEEEEEGIAEEVEQVAEEDVVEQVAEEDVVEEIAERRRCQRRR